MCKIAGNFRWKNEICDPQGWRVWYSNLRRDDISSRLMVFNLRSMFDKNHGSSVLRSWRRLYLFRFCGRWKRFSTAYWLDPASARLLRSIQVYIMEIGRHSCPGAVLALPVSCWNLTLSADETSPSVFTPYLHWSHYSHFSHFFLVRLVLLSSIRKKQESLRRQPSEKTSDNKGIDSKVHSNFTAKGGKGRRLSFSVATMAQRKSAPM